MRHQRNVRTVVTSLFLLAFCGCAGEGEHGQVASPLIGAELGETEFELYSGTTTQAGTLTWGLGPETVTRLPAPGSTSPAIPVATFTQTSIQAADGSEVCFFQGNQLVDDEGNVVFTDLNGDVYRGDQRERSRREIAYRFAGPKVLAGGKGPPIVTATVNLKRSDAEVRLLVAALVEGICGGDGL